MRIIPWLFAAVAFIAFGASYSELQRMRARFGEVTRHQFHDHRDVRQFIIRSALEGIEHPIVVIGDSITEMARFPAAINGYPIVNAGIGGATAEDFRVVAARLLENSKPFLIVVALGANEAASPTIEADYGELFDMLSHFAPHLLVIGNQFIASASVNAQIRTVAERKGFRFMMMPMTDNSHLPDHIHLNAAGYRRWMPEVIDAMSAFID